MFENLIAEVAKHKAKTGKSQGRIGIEAGILETRMCKIMKGKIEPTGKEKKALSKVLGVAEEILFDQEEQAVR